MNDLLDLLAPEDGGRVQPPPIPCPPYICPFCGGEEATHWLLGNNHWHESVRSIDSGECIAMELTRNHVVSRARCVTTEGGWIKCCYQHRTFNRDCAIDGLRRDIARARTAWPADRFTWVRTVLTSEGLDADLIDALTAEAVA